MYGRLREELRAKKRKKVLENESKASSNLYLWFMMCDLCTINSDKCTLSNMHRVIKRMSIPQGLDHNTKTILI